MPRDTGVKIFGMKTVLQCGWVIMWDLFWRLMDVRLVISPILVFRRGIWSRHRNSTHRILYGGDLQIRIQWVQKTMTRDLCLDRICPFNESDTESKEYILYLYYCQRWSNLTFLSNVYYCLLRSCNIYESLRIATVPLVVAVLSVFWLLLFTPFLHVILIRMDHGFHLVYVRRR